MTALMTLGGEGGNSFAFETIGDEVVGKIRAVELQQQTDMESGEPAFWPGGKAKEMYAVTLLTALREDATDDGMRTVYLKGSVKPESKSSLAAVRGAVKAVTGAYDLQYDAELALKYSGSEPPATRGFSPRKLWDARYTAPTMTIGESPTPVAPATAPQAASAPAGITPEQLAAMQAASAPVAAWDSDPRVPQLRAMGIADDAIRSTLNL